MARAPNELDAHPIGASTLAGTDIERDPVIEAYKPGLDGTLFRENLNLPVVERIRKAEELQRSAQAIRDAGRRMRDER